jgi:hypothetical protein
MIEKSCGKMFALSILLGLTFCMCYITYQITFAIEPGVCIQRSNGLWACNCPPGTHQEYNICISDMSSSNANTVHPSEGVVSDATKSTAATNTTSTAGISDVLNSTE